jgi:hypothetical protein
MKIAPGDIPSALFAAFWTATIGDFHFPADPFGEIDRQLAVKTQATAEEGRRIEFMLLKAKLKHSAEHQPGRGRFPGVRDAVPH